MGQRFARSNSFILGLPLAAVLTVCGPAFALDCAVDRQAKCEGDRCTVTKSPEDHGLRFSVDRRTRKVSANEGEGSRSGRANIVATSGELALSVMLGPVMQGGRPLGPDKQPLSMQVDLRSKNFAALRGSEILLGKCE